MGKTFNLLGKVTLEVMCGFCDLLWYAQKITGLIYVLQS